MPSNFALVGNDVHIKPGSEAAHKALESTLVRKYHDGVWIIPFECVWDAFNMLEPDIELDEELLNRLAFFDGVQRFKTERLDGIHVKEEEDLKTKLLSHQKQWLAFAVNFKAIANTCEQGTGKTKMALDWLTIKGLRRNLIICKNSNIYKWAEEIKKHSDFMPIILTGPRAERLEKLNTVKHRENICVIINYDYIARLKELGQVQWSAIVADESTAIKSSRTDRHKAIIKLGDKCTHRLILTGTPILNSPEDAYGQFRFLNSNLFGRNAFGFKNRYISYGGFSGYEVLGYKNLNELSTKISHYSFRKLKVDCLDLPPKTFDYQMIPQDKAFRAGYDAIVKSALLEIGDRMIDNTLAISKLGRCLQYCAGFMYTNSSKNLYTLHETPKFNELTDFMTDHFSSHEKLIIWVYHRAVQSFLHNVLSAAFPGVRMMQGSSELSANDRQDLVNAFNDSHIDQIQKRCIILQTTAFMHGIDLRCDSAYYYQRSFSLEEWLQSQDRIHGINRGGEKSSYLVSIVDGTAEVSVHNALVAKKGLSDAILRDKVSLERVMRGQL